MNTDINTRERSTSVNRESRPQSALDEYRGAAIIDLDDDEPHNSSLNNSKFLDEISFPFLDYNDFEASLNDKKIDEYKIPKLIPSSTISEKDSIPEEKERSKSRGCSKSRRGRRGGKK